MRTALGVGRLITNAEYCSHLATRGIFRNNNKKVSDAALPDTFMPDLLLYMPLVYAMVGYIVGHACLAHHEQPCPVPLLRKRCANGDVFVKCLMKNGSPICTANRAGLPPTQC